jgi:transcriptional regulator with XRE-family HTH domain
VIGARLRERRVASGLTLRDTAARAGISTGHLSDVEQANSHASLPVLVRLCRALHLPIAELLPRLGGPRVQRSTLRPSAGIERISHPQLELDVERVSLAIGGRVELVADPGTDVLLFVVSGECTVAVADARYDCGPRDTLDIERADTIVIDASSPLTILAVRAARR